MRLIKLMDMVLCPQIRNVFRDHPVKRQTCFSATFSDRVEKLAAEFLGNFQAVEVTPSANHCLRTLAQVNTCAKYQNQRLICLGATQAGGYYPAAIIFTRSRKNAEEVHAFIKNRVERRSSCEFHAIKVNPLEINSIDISNLVVRFCPPLMWLPEGWTNLGLHVIQFRTCP